MESSPTRNPSDIYFGYILTSTIHCVMRPGREASIEPAKKREGRKSQYEDQTHKGTLEDWVQYWLVIASYAFVYLSSCYAKSWYDPFTTPTLRARPIETTKLRVTPRSRTYQLSRRYTHCRLRSRPRKLRVGKR